MENEMLIEVVKVNILDLLVALGESIQYFTVKDNVEPQQLNN
jgi:hypothetical protein